MKAPARSTLHVAAVFAVTAALAGCRSGHAAAFPRSTSTTGLPSSTTSSTPSTLAATTSSSEPPPPTVPVTTSVVATCEPTSLAVAASDGVGAAGHGGETISLRNTSSKVCTLRGYPGLGLLNLSGNPVTLTVVRSGSAGFEHANVPITTVTLGLGAVASFWVEWINSDGQQVGTLEVTPPNDFQSVRIPNTMLELNVGQVVVSAVTAGVVATSG